MSLRLASVAALLAALGVAPAAVAVESTGKGENITHVKNLPYADLHDPDEVNMGTDLEFATITVAQDPAPVATPDTPTAPAPGATPVAGGSPAPGTSATPTSGAGTTPPSAAAAPTAGTAPAATTTPALATSPSAAARRALAAKRRARATCAKAKRARRGTAKRTRLKRRCAAARQRARAASRRARAVRRSAALDAQPGVPGVQKTFSFAGTYGDGLQIIDVTDPANATTVAVWDCGISQGDVQVFQREDLDGRWFVAFTADDGYDLHEDSQCVTDLTAKGFAIDLDEGGTFIAEITDPYTPTAVSFVPVAQGSHNQTVHPSGRYLYNSNADLITSALPAVEIIDITSIEAPATVGEFDLLTLPGLGTESHDITFSADGTRAYVAALSHGEILDTTAPDKPTRLGTILDPSLNVWHQMEGIKVADPVLGERNFVIAEDEVAGALGTGQCPNGGVHVYDATGPLEGAPVLVGYWNISDAGLTENGPLGTCTAHVFQIDHAQQLMTIAYYNGGVRVVDLKGLVGLALGKTGVGMKQLGYFRFPDSDTWAVKAPAMSRDGFHLYGNDHHRGFDVYEYTPGQTAARAGTWMDAQEVGRRVARFEAAGGVPRLLAVCLLEVRRRT